MHWLLPKPFSNEDFRQEPWMVHATNNMVHVSEDKIMNIAPGDIKSEVELLKTPPEDDVTTLT